MSTSQADIVTANASRYLQQLCKHWSHRFSVSFDATAGTIDLGNGKSVQLTATSEHLHTVVFAGDPEQIDGLEKVVAEHIDRFAFRETLVFDWHRKA